MNFSEISEFYSSLFYPRIISKFLWEHQILLDLYFFCQSVLAAE